MLALVCDKTHIRTKDGREFFTVTFSALSKSFGVWDFHLRKKYGSNTVINDFISSDLFNTFEVGTKYYVHFQSDPIYPDKTVCSGICDDTEEQLERSRYIADGCPEDLLV